jgi:hypothetical protein
VTEKDIRQAQTIIKGILGDVPLRPDGLGRFLLADVNLNAAPLLEAAGIGLSGSGGRI